ncbi:outer membrane protein assembly factor BamB family protein [Portibacter lacus]|uniref:PQQ-like domain-containing protein n=1 Tax=Portibacter lacus TaxID=1099794 RepID=A0AA37SUY0_9BACT|nr:PQQ-binding-like beta-propeller repeat protein [Portibacter lacus]GLR19570.1 hypothetical protein GCM10007940_41860 [Portibacter lacus]
MKPITSLETGVLPHNNRSIICIKQDSLKIGFFDYDLNLMHSISEFKLRGMNEFHCLLWKGRAPYLYNIKDKCLIESYSKLMGSTTLTDKGLILNSRKEALLQYYTNTDQKLEWEISLDYENRLYALAWSDDVLVGNVNEANKKFGIDLKSGKKLWELDKEKLKLKSVSGYIGNNQLVKGTLLSTNEEELFCLDYNSGEKLWHLHLENKLRMGHVIADKNMFLFVREVNDVYLLKIDLSEGKILSKELLTEQIQRLQVYPQGNTGTFGQLSYYDNELFFGANNQLVRLNLSSSKMEIVFDHTAEFYFSKVIGSKLFYSDNNFTTLVFELESSDQEA